MAKDKTRPFQMAPIQPEPSVQTPLVEASEGESSVTSEPIAIIDQAATPSYVPKRPTVTMNAREYDQLYHDAETDNRVWEHTKAIMDSVKVKEAPAPVAQPIPERLRLQTEAEMAAGRAMNKHFEELQASRPIRVPEKWDGKNEEVFRPADYHHEKDLGKAGSVTRTGQI